MRARNAWILGFKTLLQCMVADTPLFDYAPSVMQGMLCGIWCNCEWRTERAWNGAMFAYFIRSSSICLEQEWRKLCTVSQLRNRLGYCLASAVTGFYFGALHPVARIHQDYWKNGPSQQLFEMFIYIFSPLHVSALACHLRTDPLWVR
jgi:hypothetical protein